jgi:copper chaperone CopZ
MTSRAPYLHALDGRLRIKLPHVQGTPPRAWAVEQLLRGLDGITDVTAHPTTGNVLVLFTSAVVGQHNILTALQQSGYRSDGHAAAPGRTGLTSPVVRLALELALERLILALI